MKVRDEPGGECEWVCATCGTELEQGKAQIRYVGCTFSIDVLVCRQCDLVLITEDMAIGKIAEAEKVLEDK
ncbi:MAG: hypothetical protein A4E63_02108 [Syntrophorhabdus sp. PtaU1.Bin050]|nr:MAG: hypothetical protein A4E63_02108 [Syntrophorhabdus sp. PtaU1.Bin050]